MIIQKYLCRRGGHEPDDFLGKAERCTYIRPETRGRQGPLSVYGPYWGYIGCEIKNVSSILVLPGSNTRTLMVPICKGKFTV